MPEIESSTVAKRHVFYLSGFDPRGARFYHRLYQDESNKQAKLLGSELKVGSRTRIGQYCHLWTINANWNNAQEDKQAVRTDYFFLNWDDIVRQYWERNIVKLIWTSISGYIGYMRCGAFSKIGQYYKGPFFSALYPFLYLLVLLMLSIMLAAMSSVIFSGIKQPMFALIVASTIFSACMVAGVKLANKLGVFWLLRTYLFVNQLGLNNSLMITKRIKHFIELIKEKQQSDPADEILVIGHSVGSIVAVHLMAMYAEQYPNLASKVKLVTLGQCVPLQSGMPQAKLLHQHLALLQSQHAVQWADFLARADSLAFYSDRKLLDANISFPEMKIVRFFHLFHPKAYSLIKRNKLRIHFQYLMATELIGNYDYFTMTAGSLSLNINNKEYSHAL
jgi:hypothetical protein